MCGVNQVGASLDAVADLFNPDSVSNREFARMYGATDRLNPETLYPLKKRMRATPRHSITLRTFQIEMPTYAVKDVALKVAMRHDRSIIQLEARAVPPRLDEATTARQR
jgi:hypothetical protein